MRRDVQQWCLIKARLACMDVTRPLPYCVAAHVPKHAPQHPPPTPLPKPPIPPTPLPYTPSPPLPFEPSHLKAYTKLNLFLFAFSSLLSPFLFIMRAHPLQLLTPPPIAPLTSPSPHLSDTPISRLYVHPSQHLLDTLMGLLFLYTYTLSLPFQ